jgi:hypothetical protein
LKEVEKEFEWETEKIDLSLKKLKEKFINPIETEYFQVVDFQVMCLELIN